MITLPDSPGPTPSPARLPGGVAVGEPQARLWEAALARAEARGEPEFPIATPGLLLTVQEVRHVSPLESATGEASAPVPPTEIGAPLLPVRRSALLLPGPAATVPRGSAALEGRAAQPGAAAPARPASEPAEGIPRGPDPGRADGRWSAPPAPTATPAEIRSARAGGSSGLHGAGTPVVARHAEAAPAPRLRLHAQNGPAGVVVWAGIDGDPAAVAARAQLLLADLRRALATAPQRLACLVCNGTVVYGTAPSRHKEP